LLDYLVDVRTAVEGKVVELVAKRADADLSTVCAVLEQTEAEIAKSVERGSLGLRFETTLARGAGNPLLNGDATFGAPDLVEAWSERHLAPGDWHRFHAEHLANLDALESGDGEAAQCLVADHVNRTVKNAAPRKKGTRER
jgi:DNA-binding GntR family transcriptional regulator